MRWSVIFVCLLACSGENQYDVQARTASLFARALYQRDTVRMRQLSTPIAGTRMALALGEIPRMYTDFGEDIPAVVRLGNPKSTDFFVASRSLRACHGGLLISVSPADAHRVSSVRLRPESGCLST